MARARVGHVQKKILLVMYANAPARMWTYEIAEAAGVAASANLYQTCRKLENDRGYVTSEWEDPAVAESANRPRRRYYKITGSGIADVQEHLLDTPTASALLPGLGQLSQP